MIVRLLWHLFADITTNLITFLLSSDIMRRVAAACDAHGAAAITHGGISTSWSPAVSALSLSHAGPLSPPHKGQIKVGYNKWERPVFTVRLVRLGKSLFVFVWVCRQCFTEKRAVMVRYWEQELAWFTECALEWSHLTVLAAQTARPGTAAGDLKFSPMPLAMCVLIAVDTVEQVLRRGSKWFHTHCACSWRGAAVEQPLHVSFVERWQDVTYNPSVKHSLHIDQGNGGRLRLQVEGLRFKSQSWGRWKASICHFIYSVYTTLKP